jgi:hypothetical protein
LRRRNILSFPHNSHTGEFWVCRVASGGTGRRPKRLQRTPIPFGDVVTHPEGKFFLLCFFG